ncbi:MAG: magnesium transporter [Thermoplasmata archaeon]
MRYHWKNIFKESAGILALMAFIGIAGGHVLESIEGELILFPILLFLIPILNGVGGNLGAVLGAKLSSGLHAGFIYPDFFDQEIKENLWLTITMGAMVFTGLAIGVSVSSFALPFGLTFAQLLLIILGTGGITTTSITFITVFTTLYSYNKNMDPDNVVIPIVTTVCDFIGIVALVFMIWLVII